MTSLLSKQTWAALSCLVLTWISLRLVFNILKPFLCVNGQNSKLISGYIRETSVNCSPKWDSSPSYFSSAQRGVKTNSCHYIIVSQSCLQNASLLQALSFSNLLLQQVFGMVAASDQGWQTFLPADYSYSLLPPEAIRFFFFFCLM